MNAKISNTAEGSVDTINTSSLRLVSIVESILLTIKIHEIIGLLRNNDT